MRGISGLAFLILLLLVLRGFAEALPRILATVGRAVFRAATREEVRTTTVGPAVSADQFAELFRWLVNQAASFPGDRRRAFGTLAGWWCFTRCRVVVLGWLACAQICGCRRRHEAVARGLMGWVISARSSSG